MSDWNAATSTDYTDAMKPWSDRVPAAIAKAEEHMADHTHDECRCYELITATEVALAEALWEILSSEDIVDERWAWPPALIAFAEKAESL